MVRNNIFTLTNIVILITVIMYFVQTSMSNGSILMGMNILFLEHNFWHQPLSTIFAHGGLLHLTFNMLVLFQIGNLIEYYKGKTFFISLYILGGITTSLGSFLFIYSLGLNHNMVGASGAICVLLGYLALLDKSQRKGIITMILLISFLPLFIGIPIAWYAHIIGFIIGWLLGYLF